MKMYKVGFICKIINNCVLSQIRTVRGTRFIREVNKIRNENDSDNKSLPQKQINLNGELEEKLKQLNLKPDLLKTLENPTPTHKNADLDHYLDFTSDVQKYRKKIRQREADTRRNQANKAFRPKVDSSDTTVVLFPGQGSQFVGMGKMLLGYPNVKDLFGIAGKILGYDLLEICLKGPKSTLDKTLYCQPAIVVTSLAAVEKLKYDNPRVIESCITTAGYSVGEISSLVFAGALSFEDAIHLVKYRSEAMQKASEKTSGGMMTVFISPSTKLKFACLAARLYCKQELNIDDAICEISNYLHPSCKVIAGNTQALDFIAKNTKEFNIKRATYLPVSGAFHSKLMQPAVELLKSQISSLKFSDPIIPIHSNVTGSRFKNAEDIKRLILKQLCKPVKWEQILHSIYARPQGKNFPQTYEVGPGRQMGSLLKMVNSKAFESYFNVDV